MPFSSQFQECCGINIIAGFPWDDGDEGGYEEDLDESGNDWLAQSLESLPTEIKKLEGTYCKCHLIALNKHQRASEAKVLEAGYILVGDFPSAMGKSHGRVKLFARGLALASNPPAKPPRTLKRPKKTGGKK